MPYITHLNLKHINPHHIPDMVNGLLDRSAYAGVLTEREREPSTAYNPVATRDIQPMRGVFHIIEIEKNKNWPHWPSRNCVVAGCLPQKTIAPDTPLFFLHACYPGSLTGDFDAFCERWVGVFDWVLFSYFTSFWQKRLTFITCHQWLQEKIQKRLPADLDTTALFDYQRHDIRMADLKAATFSNDNGEWLAPVVLAQQANEPHALLLCCFDETNIDGASTEEDEHGNQIIRPVTPWYAAYISRLLQITSFDIENPAISPTSALENYRLYVITDINAYHNICARNSTDWDITIATFAGDCDIAKLQKLITQYKGYHSTPTEEILPLSGWTYWSEYGGGSDEHLGLFYAKDARLTDALWQRLATGQRDAFFAPLYSITFYDSDQEICSLPFMVAEALRQEPPLLLCRFDGRLAYSQWDAENWEYRPDTCWYAQDLNKLSLVAKFNHGHFEYQVFKVTDSNACLRLWSEKMGNAISQALFAADCDLIVLEQRLADSAVHYLPEQLAESATWSYTRAFPVGRDYWHFHAKTNDTFQAFQTLYKTLLQDPKRAADISRY